MRQHHLSMAVDLGWVALSAIVAVLIRDNFVPWQQHLNAVTAYAVVAVATSAIVFSLAGIHKRLWQYTSLPDVLRIVAAVTVALLLAIFISFVFSRLDGVARSVPVIQWFLLLSAMVATRVAMRIWNDRRRKAVAQQTHAELENVLLVGVSHLTELFLESVAQYASKQIDVIGILSDQRDLHGRLLRFQKILGSPEELPKVLAQLEVHGVSIDRIVVTQIFEDLSVPARHALREIESGSSLKVEWLSEILGLSHRHASSTSQLAKPSSLPVHLSAPVERGVSTSYSTLKRVLDVAGVVVFAIGLLPLLIVITFFVVVDVGFPIVFWQKRPGQLGRPFKLYKFCTMKAAHDAHGLRIPDEERSSTIGRLLRRSRLDELPQLYNILVGEMSFVGPRPLLPFDQPGERHLRQLVKPGLTGMAQVYGTRDISPEDKNVLDVWYVQHASLWLDIKILLKTPLVMLRGERIDQLTLWSARNKFERDVGQSDNVPARNATSPGEQPARALL